MIEHILLLDVLKQGCQQRLFGFKAGEANVRRLNVMLTCGGKALSLCDGAHAEIYSVRPDGSKCHSTCEIDINGDRISHVMTTGEVAVAGRLECEIRIQLPAGENNIVPVLYSPRFDIMIDETLYSEDSIISDDLNTEWSDTLRRIDDAESALMSCRSILEAKADKAELEKKAGAAEVGERFEVIEEVLEELIAHEHIKFTVLQVSASAVEIGSSINVNIHAVTDREAAQIEIYNGTELLYSAEDSSVADTIISGVSSDTVISVVATDEFGHDTVNERAISFCNGVYTGAGTGGTMISDLNKTLRADRKVTFTVTAGDGEYIYYACPTAMGTPSFYVGGIEGGFELISSGEYTNMYGCTENYQVWRSVNTDLGTIKVEVK